MKLGEVLTENLQCSRTLKELVFPINIKKSFRFSFETPVFLMLLLKDDSSCYRSLIVVSARSDSIRPLL